MEVPWRVSFQNSPLSDKEEARTEAPGQSHLFLGLGESNSIFCFQPHRFGINGQWVYSCIETSDSRPDHEPPPDQTDSCGSPFLFTPMAPEFTHRTEADLETNGWTAQTFKNIDSVDLKIWHKPSATLGDGQATAAIVFYYGGGWRGRNINHFQRQAEHLSTRGMTVFLADYRSSEAYVGSPFDCVEDAKSAMRYVRQNAAKFGTDPNRIAAGGGSAGGHLAAACALLPDLNDPNDPPISCKPAALVLFNPVYDNGPGGYGHDRIKDRWREISPIHSIEAGAPPNIVFLGTEDHLVPVQTAERWKAKMEECEVRSELYLYPSRKHGFFNQEPDYTDTLQKADNFLVTLGYLPSGESQYQHRTDSHPPLFSSRSMTSPSKSPTEKQTP